MKLLIITQKVDENDQLLGFFIEWIRLFSKNFEKVTVLCLEKGKFELPKNVEVISLGKDRGARKLKTLYNLYSLIYTRRHDYDAVFAHMNPVWVISGGTLWKVMRKKCFFWYTSGGVTTKLKWAEKFADVVFTASKESFRLPSKKVIVIGHGIDTELFKPDPNYKPQTTNHKLKLLSVGRISPVKNYETLIDAAKILKNGGVDFSVTMVGEAPLQRDMGYDASLKLKIKSLKLEENFSFIGKVEHKNLPRYYQSHDIFVHLSKTGSLDKAILEAMSCGIKVLSSNDSSRTFLSSNLMFGDRNPKELADKITAVNDSPVDSNLRSYVIQNHNLENLINKISNHIKS